MMDRALATKLLIADRFPLMTILIQDHYDLVHARRLGPPANSIDMKEMWSKFEIHFSEAVYDIIEKDNSAYIAGLLCNDEVVFDDPHATALRKLFIEFIRYRNYLNQLSNREFLDEYEPLRLKRQEELSRKANDYDLRQFYSFPEASADLDYWITQPSWTSDEATALAFGKDPDIVSEATLRPMENRDASLFVNSYFRFKRRLDRAIVSGLLKEPLTPLIFFDWAAQHADPIPFQRLANCFEKTDAISANKPQKGEENVRTQHIHSLYRIVLGIIISKYQSTADSHDLQGREDKYKQILQDVQDAGLSMDRHTLRLRLNAAYDYASRKALLKAPRGKRPDARKSSTT